jgi:hypothetical protein
MPPAKPSTGIIEQLLDRADIRVGGSRIWDIQIHNPSDKLLRIKPVMGMV